jgi:hypothetical protein
MFDQTDIDHRGPIFSNGIIGMLVMVLTISTCLAVFNPVKSQSHVDIRFHTYDSALWEIADLIYNLEHDKAELAIQEIRPELESHPIYDFLVSLNIVWQTIPEVPGELELLENHLKQAIVKSELRLVNDKSDPEGLLFGIMAH